MLRARYSGSEFANGCASLGCAVLAFAWREVVTGKVMRRIGYGVDTPVGPRAQLDLKTPDRRVLGLSLAPGLHTAQFRHRVWFYRLKLIAGRDRRSLVAEQSGRLRHGDPHT
jgi:hypothetical protein